MDFTHAIYKELLQTCLTIGYQFITFKQYTLGAPRAPHIILRHDVDRLPGRSLKLARLEHQLNIPATYFFRTKRVSFSQKIIQSIHDMGHEIGYHYENLSDTKGNHDLAWEDFKSQLNNFDPRWGVESIAMHGRPLRPWDNRDLWQTKSYQDVGIKLEAYQDVEWSQYAYFTDVGRAWNHAQNQRDKTDSIVSSCQTTAELINWIKQNQSNMPNIIISTHPERWADSYHGWAQVLMTDSATNIIKAIVR